MGDQFKQFGHAGLVLGLHFPNASIGNTQMVDDERNAVIGYYRASRIREVTSIRTFLPHSTLFQRSRNSCG